MKFSQLKKNVPHLKFFVYCFTGFIGIIGGLIFHVRLHVFQNHVVNQVEKYTCRLRDIIIHMIS